MKYYFLEGTFKEGRPEGAEFKKSAGRASHLLETVF